MPSRAQQSLALAQHHDPWQRCEQRFERAQQPSPHPANWFQTHSSFYASPNLGPYASTLRIMGNVGVQADGEGNRLGVGAIADLVLSPAKAAVSGATAVAAGMDFTVWLCDGRVWSAGNPQFGQLGHGTDHEYNASDCARPRLHHPAASL